MEEAAWLQSGDAGMMLALAAGWRAWDADARPPGWTPLSDRKRGLFLAACVRHFYEVLPPSPPFREAVETAERHAEGMATSVGASDACESALREWVRLYSHRTPPARPCPELVARSAARACSSLGPGGRDGIGPEGHAGIVLRHTHGQDGSPEARDFQAHLLRCVAGNPFRPVVLGHRLFGQGLPEDMEGAAGPGGCMDTCRVTPTVRSLAQAAYDDRTPQGWLDAVRLAVLADALEEAGSAAGRGGRAVLWSLRGFDWCPGCAAGNHGSEQFCGGRGYDGRHGWVPAAWPRVRGYWALDLLLGKL